MGSPDDSKEPTAVDEMRVEESDTSTMADEPGAVSGDESATRGDEADDPADPSGRDVIVPLRLYKTITVFSTLIAVVSILAGFVILDRATQRATVSPEDVNLVLALAALALIVGGSAVYAFSTRFRTAGMGKSKDATDEESDNG